MSLPSEHVCDPQTWKKQRGREEICFCLDKPLAILCEHIAAEVKDDLFLNSELQMWELFSFSVGDWQMCGDRV